MNLDSSSLAKKRTKRDPQATREAILNAATTILSKDGPDALSVSKVAHLAGVNRGTAYQHFETREELVKATLQLVSQRICEYVFPGGGAGKLSPSRHPIEDVTQRLVEFAIENPELGRIWLFDVLASSNPANDPFFKLFKGSTERLAKSDYGQEDIDSEALSVLMLAGYFLWPVWVRAHSKNKKERKKMAQRMSREILRLTLYGVLQPNKHPEVVALLKELTPE